MTHVNAPFSLHTDTQTALFTVQLAVPSSDAAMHEENGYSAGGVFLVTCSVILLSIFSLQRLWHVDHTLSDEEDEKEKFVCLQCGMTRIPMPEAHTFLPAEELGNPLHDENGESQEEPGEQQALIIQPHSLDGQIVVAGSVRHEVEEEEEEEEEDLRIGYDTMIRLYGTQLEDPNLTPTELLRLHEKIIEYREKKANHRHQERKKEYMDQVIENKEIKLRDQRDNRFFKFLDAHQHRYFHFAQLALFVVWIVIKLRRLAPTTTSTLHDSLPWWLPRSLIPNVSHMMCGGILLILILLIATIVLAQGNKWAFVCVVTTMGLVALWSMTTLKLALILYTGLRLAIGLVLVMLLGLLLFWSVQSVGWVTRERTLRSTLILHGMGMCLVLLAVALGFELSTTEFPDFRFYSIEASLLNLVDKTIQAIDNH